MILTPEEIAATPGKQGSETNSAIEASNLNRLSSH